MTLIRPRDLQAVGFCNRGARAWFDLYGFDWTRMVRHGIPAEELRARFASPDGQLEAVIAAAEAREAAEGA